MSTVRDCHRGQASEGRYRERPVPTLVRTDPFCQPRNLTFLPATTYPLPAAFSSLLIFATRTQFLPACLAA